MTKNMKPFDSYRREFLLRYPGGGNCRHKYGLRFMRWTGQTQCAYCESDLVKPFEKWLQTVLDHAIPKSVCKSLGLNKEWTEACMNKVLACSACNGFKNRYSLSDYKDRYSLSDVQCPQSIEEFCRLRDCIFQHRKTLIADRRKEEQIFYCAVSDYLTAEDYEQTKQKLHELKTRLANIEKDSNFDPQHLPSVRRHYKMMMREYQQDIKLYEAQQAKQNLLPLA